MAGRDGVLSAPAGDAARAPAAVPDLIEATAAVIVQPGHDERVYELTGPRSVDWPDLAAVASELEGRQIAYDPVSDDVYRERLTVQGLPKSAVDGLIELYRDLRAGWLREPDDGLARLLNRPAVDTLDAIRQRLP